MENNRQQTTAETDDELRQRLFDDCMAARKELARLSPRQLEVAIYTAKGFQHAEVASLLKCSVSTVHSHAWDAFRRLDLNSRIEMSVLVAKAGMA